MLLLQSVLRRIVRKGRLTVVAPDGRSYDFGNGSPSVTIRFADWAVVRRLSLDPDLAAGEAYMNGTLVVENGGVYDFLDLCFGNLGWGRGHWLRRAHALAGRLGRRLAQHNPVSVARANVSHHCDLSDMLYEFFLDNGRQCSCAYYMSPDDTPEKARERKKRNLAAKLSLRPGQRVLDIGQRVDRAGLTERVRVELKDYRHENGRYDRIVSVGMFEHVGAGHCREYFDKIRDLLADDGVALIHTKRAHAANPQRLARQEYPQCA